MSGPSESSQPDLGVPAYFPKKSDRYSWKSTATLLMSALTLAVLVFAVVWQFWVRDHDRDLQDKATATSLDVIGLSRPVHNRLAPNYMDADGDLIADAPADASKLINPEKLVFSYVATSDPGEYKMIWKDFTDYLSKVTGKPVEYLELKSPNEELKAMREGRLQVAGFNTGAVPAAVDLCGFVPMYTVGTPNHGATYTMQLIVPADSPIKTPKDIKGHTLAVVDPSSNAGYKAPVVILSSDFDLLPERDYVLQASYGHDASIAGIAEKKYEVAAVASDLLARAVGNQRIRLDQFSVIYTSEQFHSAAIGRAYNLAPELAAKVKEAFETFKWPGTTLEKSFSKSGETTFSPVDYKSDWALVRRIDDAIGQEYQIK